MLERYFESARREPSLMSGEEARDLLARSAGETDEPTGSTGIGRGAKVGAAATLVLSSLLVASLTLFLPEMRRDAAAVPTPETNRSAVAALPSAESTESMGQSGSLPSPPTGLLPTLPSASDVRRAGVADDPGSALLAAGRTQEFDPGVGPAVTPPSDLPDGAIEKNGAGEIGVAEQSGSATDEIGPAAALLPYRRTIVTSFAEDRGSRDERIRVTTIAPLNTSTSHEYNPLVSPDGETLYFTSSNVNGLGGHDIWIASRRDGATDFSPPVNLGSRLNSSQDEGGVTMSGDGRTMYFTSCGRAGGLGDCDLYEARLSDDGWEEVRNLREINTGYWESHPSVSRDGQTLYFVSTRPGAVGGRDDADIWVSRRQGDGSWTTPENLGRTINTREREDSPFIAPDGDRLYFSSKGHPGRGAYDFFVAERNGEGGWQQPQNLGPEINTGDSERFLSLSAGEDVIYFARAEAGSDEENYNLFVAERRPLSEAAIITGTLRQTDRNDYIRADLLFVDRLTGRILGRERAEGEEESRFSLVLAAEEMREGGEILLYGLSDDLGQFHGRLPVPGRDSYREYRFDLVIDSTGSSVAEEEPERSGTTTQIDQGIATALHRGMLLVQGRTLRPGTLQILDAHGTEVLRREIAPDETGPDGGLALDVRDLPDGLYLIRTPEASSLFRIASEE